MKRRPIHLLCGLGALVFAALALYQAERLHQAGRVNRAISSASAAAGPGMGASAAAATAGLDPSVPEARLARAIALSKAGNYDAALDAYKAVIQDKRDDLRQIALYDLGNLHLRQSLTAGPESAVTKALPLIELAKQSYRDLLRAHPDDWDARYNLERALWLAPETEDLGAGDDGKPQSKFDFESTHAGLIGDLP